MCLVRRCIRMMYLSNRSLKFVMDRVFGNWLIFPNNSGRSPPTLLTVNPRKLVTHFRTFQLQQEQSTVDLQVQL